MPLTLTISPNYDLWDEDKNEFISFDGQTLVLEHSLIAISKWEQKWKKAFISMEDKTNEEFFDYIRCMTINKVNDVVYSVLTQEDINKIEQYMADPMTATTISNFKQGSSREIVTNEIIYYNMIKYGIPCEFEKWHINRLITLIQVFNIKEGNVQKMSASEAAALQRSVNERRLRKSGKR